MRRGGSGVAAVVAGAAGLGVARDLLARTAPLGRLPLWDGAGNGWGAVELWSALSQGHLVDLAVRLNAQDKWPFGFSLLMLPFVAVGGGSFASAALLPALAFALVPALLVWAAAEVDRDGRGIAAGLLAGALWLVSPVPRALATVAMRETAGAALALAVLATWLRARRLGTLAAWRLCGGLLLAQFFVKANYFLLAATALALHAALEMPAEARRAAAGRWRGRITRAGWSAPERWLALVVAIAAAALAAGQNPGNFLYGALVVAVAAGIVLALKGSFRPLATLRALPPAPRALAETLLLPVGLWSLSPSPIHPRNVIAFLRNREGAEPVFSAASLAFYPRQLAEHFAPGERAGWAIAAVALVATASFVARRGDPARALGLTAAVGAVALALHPLKEGRFLATLAPALFLVTTLAAVRAVARLLPETPAPRFATGAALLGLSFYGVFFLSRQSQALARLEIDHELLTGDPALAAPLDELARRVGGEGRPALLGGVNEISESLVRWRAWQRDGREAALVDPLRGLTGREGAARVGARLDAWLARERPTRIVALEFPAGSPRLADRDFRLYNAWQVEAARRLSADHGWRATDRASFAALGGDVVTWSPPPGRSAPRVLN